MADVAGEVLSVETPESVAFAYELAGLGSRGIAFALDIARARRDHPRRDRRRSARRGRRLLLTRRNLLVLARPVGRSRCWSCSSSSRTGATSSSARSRAAGARRASGRSGIRVVRDDGSRVGARRLAHPQLPSPRRRAARAATPSAWSPCSSSRKHKRLGDIAGGDGRRARRRRARAAVRRRRVGRARRARARVPRSGARDLTPEARYQVAVAVLADVRRGARRLGRARRSRAGSRELAGRAAVPSRALTARVSLGYR